MNLSPEHFIGTRRLEVHGVVRGSQEAKLGEELHAILDHHVRAFQLKLHKAVTESNVDGPLRQLDWPLLSVTGWPRVFTPDFTPPGIS